MTPRFCRIQRHVGTRLPGTARVPGRRLRTERAELPTTRVGAAAHNVDGDTANPLPSATTSRRAIPPSTMWTAACAIIHRPRYAPAERRTLNSTPARVEKRLDQEKESSYEQLHPEPQSGINLSEPEDCRRMGSTPATTQREAVQSTLLALRAMEKCNCCGSPRVLDLRHATVSRPPPALLNAPRTE